MCKIHCEYGTIDIGEKENFCEIASFSFISHLFKHSLIATIGQKVEICQRLWTMINVIVFGLINKMVIHKDCIISKIIRFDITYNCKIVLEFK